MPIGEPQRDDLAAMLGARRDLGDEYDAAFVENFVERVASEIEARVDERVTQALQTVRTKRRFRASRSLAVLSLALGIPITAIAGGQAHLAGLGVAWGGIVAINIANAWRPEPTASRYRHQVIDVQRERGR